MLLTLIFMMGNLIAVIGGFMALLWVTTSSRFYWRKRRRGMMALTFIGVGLFLMYTGSSGGAPLASPGMPSLFTAHDSGVF